MKELEEYQYNLREYQYCKNRIGDLSNQLSEFREELKALKSVWSLFFACLIYAVLLTSLWLLTKSGLVVWLLIYPGILIPVMLEDWFKKMITKPDSDKINKSIAEVNEDIDRIKNISSELSDKLNLFEEERVKYYLEDVEQYYQTNLFNKRSGNKEFEGALTEFRLIIEELAALNDTFITTEIPLFKYQDYLFKREINHNEQSTKISEKVESIRNLVRKVSEVKPNDKKVLPPQSIRTARKVDWDKLNNKKRLTGLKGQEIAVIIEKEYLESINRRDLADKVKDVASELGDGLGYDVLSYFDDGKEKYIEVKSTTNSIEAPYFLSRNELAFLKEHPTDYFLYRILVPDHEDGDVIFRSYDSTNIIDMNEITPISYLVERK